jgi:hypothetical protein
MGENMSVLLDWITSFGKILGKPTPQTFRQEAEKAKGKTNSAFVLLFLFLPLSCVILHHFFRFPCSPDDLPAEFIMSIFFPLLFYFYVLFTNFLYKRLFKRKKDYVDELLYLYVIIFYLCYIFNVATSYIPVIGFYLSWGTYLYFIILNILALRSLTKLKLWQSTITVIISLLIGLIGVILIPMFIFSLMRTVPSTFGG